MMSAFGASRPIEIFGPMLRPGEECENMEALMRYLRSMSNVKREARSRLNEDLAEMEAKVTNLENFFKKQAEDSLVEEERLRRLKATVRAMGAEREVLNRAMADAEAELRRSQRARAEAKAEVETRKRARWDASDEVWALKRSGAGKSAADEAWKRVEAAGEAEAEAEERERALELAKQKAFAHFHEMLQAEEEFLRRWDASALAEV